MCNSAHNVTHCVLFRKQLDNDNDNCHCHLNIHLNSVFSASRGAVCNVLLTCCKDSVCRLWSETLLPSDCLLSGLRQNHSSNSNNNDTLKSSNIKKAHYNNKGQSRNLPEVSNSSALMKRLQMY